MKYISALMTTATGKIKGLVASHNTYGQYFRGKVIPVNPNSGLQQLARAAFTVVSQAWRTLTKAQQAAWAAVSPLLTRTDPLGNQVTLSGQAAYMSANNRQQSAGLAVFTDPPGTVLAAPTVLSSTFNGTTGVFNLQLEAAPPEGGTFVILSSALAGPGRNWLPSPTKVIGTSTTANFSGSATSGNTAMKALGALALEAPVDSQANIAIYAVSTNSLPSPNTLTRALLTRP